MIVIQDQIIVSEDLIDEHFICNLSACKGACCVGGDGGAPLEMEELGILDDIYEAVEPYLTAEGKQAIEEQGRYVLADEESEYSTFATPLIGGAACAYINYDALGVAQCAIQQAHQKGAIDIDFPKPISCHLYPIRITPSEHYDAVNYSRWELCSAACELGEKHKVPLFQFLKEPLIRKYGTAFFNELEAAAKHLKDAKNK